MTPKKFFLYLNISITAFFGAVHAQISDVGKIFIGVYNSTTGLPMVEDYVFSFSDRSNKVLPVYALVYSGNAPSQTVAKTVDINITCDVSATRPGFSEVRLNSVILSADSNTTNISMILGNPGRPVTVKCFAQSLSGTCPATAGGAQFCPDTSVSNSVSVMIRPPGSVSICEPLVIIKNNGPGSNCAFFVRLSEPANSNVNVNCIQDGSLNLRFQPLVIGPGSVDGQINCTVVSGTADSGTSVTCHAQSQSGSQFFNNSVSTSTARFVLSKVSTMKFSPAWSEVYNTTFISHFYMSEPLKAGSVSVTCQASVVATILDAENAAKTPNCYFTTGLTTTASTTASTTTATTTSSTTTASTTTGTTATVTGTTGSTTSAPSTTPTPPTTPSPTTPPDPNSPWRVVNSEFTFTSSTSVFQVVKTERLRQVIDIRTEIIVTTCCVLSSSSNYQNQSAVAVAVAHLAPYVCSKCSDASFTNPRDERVLQNPGYVEVAPCACDLTQNACDIHCCCDSDCSKNERLRFNGCIPGLPGGQSPEPQDYKCSSNAFNQPDWQTLTCVYWENNWYLGLFYKNRQKLKSIDEISAMVYKNYKGKFSLGESERRFVDVDTGQQNYKYGVIIKTVREDVASNTPTHFGTLALSQPGPGAACNPLGPVRYLVDQKYACKTIVTKEQCTELSVLSARIYVMSSYVTGCPQSHKVRKTLSGEMVTPTDVRYYCATDATIYLPSTVASLESLNPTSSSNFPPTFANVNCCDNCSDPVCWQYNTNRSTETVTDIPSCNWDNSFNPPEVSVFEPGVCKNVVVDVRYNFEWKGTEITKLLATIIMANISLINDSAEIIQKFSVNWMGKSNTSLPLSDNYADTTETYQRSGSAGYDIGKPLISGRSQYNVTTGQFGPVDVISEKQMAIWRPGVDGLCAAALRQPVTFGNDVLSGCALRLNFSYLSNNCVDLRQLITNHLNVLMTANVIGRYGHNDVNNQSMWIPVLRQQLNISDSQDASNTTEDLQSWANSITGICLVPSAVNLHVLYAQTGAVNDYPRYEVLGAYINYTLTNWTMDCMGVNTRRCGMTSSYTQNFILTSSVTFTQVPAKPSVTTRFEMRCDPDNFVTDTCYRYFNDFVREECYYDTCWQELAYPLLSVYIAEAKMYSLPFFLVLVLGIVGYVSVARPGWS